MNRKEFRKLVVLWKEKAKGIAAAADGGLDWNASEHFWGSMPRSVQAVLDVPRKRSIVTARGEESPVPNRLSPLRRSGSWGWGWNYEVF